MLENIFRVFHLFSKYSFASLRVKKVAIFDSDLYFRYPFFYAVDSHQKKIVYDRMLMLKLKRIQSVYLLIIHVKRMKQAF